MARADSDSGAVLHRSDVLAVIGTVHSYDDTHSDEEELEQRSVPAISAVSPVLLASTRARHDDDDDTKTNDEEEEDKLLRSITTPLTTLKSIAAANTERLRYFPKGR